MVARTLTEHDIDVVCYYKETTKGAAEESTAYIPIRGILTSLSFKYDKGRKNRKRDGEGCMDAVQTIDHDTVTGEFSYLFATDYKSADSTTVLNMTGFAMGQNSLHAATGRVLTRGTKYITFTSGSATLLKGRVVTGGTSSATAIITEVLITSGALVDGDAVGVVVLDKVTGAFQASEALNIGGVDSATSAAANTEVWANLDTFTLWVREKFDTVLNHVFAGCTIKTLKLGFAQSGEVTMTVSFQAYTYSTTAPASSTAPATSEIVALPPFRWQSSDSTLTFTRFGTDAGLEDFEISIDNSDLHYCPQDGYAYAEDLVPTGLACKLNLTGRVRDTEPYTAFVTDPNTTKSLAYDAQSSNFTAGAKLMGQTSGATAIIVSDTDDGATGTLVLRDINGVFANNETITDDATPSAGSATVDGTLTDAGTFDFSLILSKNSAVEYYKFETFNAVPDGPFAWEYSPMDDKVRTFDMPLNVLKHGNLRITIYSPPA